MVSRAPVGSSANNISGSLANALAIATRCFSPPDNLFTFCFCILFISSFASNCFILLLLLVTIFILSITVISSNNL